MWLELPKSVFISDETNNILHAVKLGDTVRPRDTRPQAARTLQVHIFELGPKIFDMHDFARFCTFLHVFARFLINEYLRCTFLHVFTRFCTFFST